MKIIKTVLILILFTLCFTSLKAQEITMFSSFTGYKYYQDDKEIDKKELQALLYKNEQTKAYWKKSKGQNIGFAVGFAAEFGFALWMASELLNDDPSLGGKEKAKNALGPALGAVGSGIIGGIFMYASTNSKKKAILAYNKQFDNKATFRLVPTGNQNGIGLALKF